MVVLDTTFDFNKFQECFEYVQSSLKWLLACDQASQVAMFPYDALEETIVASKALILDLTSLTNNIQAPISRLPSEIFGHILSFLKDDPMPLPNPADSDEYKDHLDSMGSWHRPSLVCRRWRQEVLGTPGLWTMIRVSDDSDAVHRWATTWLSRSGALPLTIIFDTDVEEYRMHKDDIQCILAEKSRLHAVGFYQTVDKTDLEPFLMQVAAHLKTLWTVAKNDFDTTPEDSPCELPQLQTLSVAHGNIWRMWPMHELRSLVLGSRAEQVWSAENLRGFFSVLKANPRLEELMLCGICISDDTWDEILNTSGGRHSPIRMEGIKRLFVEEHYFDRDQFPMMTVLQETLSLSPSCTRYYHIPYGARFEPDIVYPVKRLVISLKYLIGTDGPSACIIYLGAYQEFHAGSLWDGQVQELWIHHTTQWRDMGRGKPIGDIQSVTKLVIGEENIPLWLEVLKCNFPALKELHLLVQRHDDKQAILQFLADRREKGVGVETLCFVGGRYNSEAFDAWKNDPSEFEHLTTQVKFEEVHNPSSPLFEHLMSTRLGLPEVCKHPSLTSTIWQPWNEFTRFQRW